MQKLLIALHILFAIFAIGPLVGAATTAARGVRGGDGPAVTAAARTIRSYGYVSIVVGVIGLGLVQPKWHNKFSYPWVWISLVLFVAAIALALALLVPGLLKAGELIAHGTSAQALVGRTAATGGIIAILFAVILFLMVYQPGGTRRY